MSRKLTRTATVFVAVFAAVALAAAPASAAPDTVEPQGFGWCDGIHPSRWGDARTVRSNTTIGGAIIETRYSPSARCAWGRMRLPFSASAEVKATRDIDLKTFVKSGGGDTLALDDAGVLVQVCGNDWAGGGFVCNDPF